MFVAPYLIEGALNTVAGVAPNVCEGPAQSTQAVVGSVASPVHQMLPSLFPYR